eukprot:gene6344-biopygen2409
MRTWFRPAISARAHQMLDREPPLYERYHKIVEEKERWLGEKEEEQYHKHSFCPRISRLPHNRNPHSYSSGKPLAT